MNDDQFASISIVLEFINIFIPGDHLKGRMLVAEVTSLNEKYSRLSSLLSKESLSPDAIVQVRHMLAMLILNHIDQCPHLIAEADMHLNKAVFPHSSFHHTIGHTLIPISHHQDPPLKTNVAEL